MRACKLDKVTNLEVANAVRNFDAKIASLEESLKHTTSESKRAKLNQQLLEAQQGLKEAEDSYVSEYYEHADNGELRAHRATIESELSVRSDLYGGASASSWKAVDDLGTDSDARISANSVALNRLQAQYDSENLSIEAYERDHVEVLQNKISELDSRIEQAETKRGPWGGPSSTNSFPAPGNGPVFPNRGPGGPGPGPRP